MQFFKGKRPEVYIHVAKPRRDKQTGKRFWCLTLIVTMNDDLAMSCGGQIAAAYAYLLTLENSAVEVLLDALLPGCAVGFYAIVDDADPALQLVEVEIGAFRLTRKKDIVELWFSFEKEVDTPGLHGFAKQFMFTRLHAQFTPPADLFAVVSEVIAASEQLLAESELDPVTKKPTPAAKRAQRANRKRDPG